MRKTKPMIAKKMATKPKKESLTSQFHYPEPITTGKKRPKFRNVMERKEVSVKYYLSMLYKAA